MPQTWHSRLWNPAFLVLRIDRCYLLAAGARVPAKRAFHLERARYYRRMLGSVTAAMA